MTKKTVRILAAVPLDGVIYQPNDLVAFEKPLADQLCKAGRADSSAAAVKYCKSQGVEVVDHAPAVEVAADEDQGDGDEGEIAS